ncbi:hypothetical protein PPL_00969 [Heterostelium album PN500]|uniref:Uncharacterized protein n=1 Tax=Heterostelium pallidum (strain ATCC 26659 / Pp 5 / PN500) TaxID=670386 RepID=D3AXR2_HETP5|nr:hypothetical protein PPL_00969 [Heterostelium album PN500]EFA85739.1 hypothetical protein PPL_00969 [Heterostelium album PN500]|eukprot:XP_020437845.1 hypothetical protein PPL_00969 [Heterostelium album PN500]
MFNTKSNLLILFGLMLVCCLSVRSTDAAVQSYIWDTTVDCSNIAGCDFYNATNYVGNAPVAGVVNAGGVIIDYSNTTFTTPQYITVINGSTIDKLYVRGPQTNGSNLLDFQVWRDDSGLVVDGSVWFDQANLAVHDGVFTVNNDFFSLNGSTTTLVDAAFIVVGTTDFSEDSSFTGTNQSTIALDGDGYIFFGCTPVLDQETIFNAGGANTTFERGINAETNAGMVFLNATTLNGISSIQQLRIENYVNLGSLATLSISTYCGRGPATDKPVINVGSGNLLISGGTQDENAPTVVDLYAINAGYNGVVRIVNFVNVSIDYVSSLGPFTLDTVDNAYIGGAVSPVDGVTPIVSSLNDFRLAGSVGLTVNATTILSISYIPSQLFSPNNIGATIYVYGQTALINATTLLNSTIFQVQSGANFMVENDLQFTGKAGIYLMGEMTLNGTILSFDQPKPAFTLNGGSLLAINNVTINGNVNFLNGLFQPSGVTVNGDYYQIGGTILFLGVTGENLIVSGDFTVSDQVQIGFDNALIPDVEAVIHVEGLPQVEASIVIQMSQAPEPDTEYYLISSLNQSISGMIASFDVVTPVINSYKSSIVLTDPALSMVLEFTSQPAGHHNKMAGWKVFLIILGVVAGIALIGLGYRYYVRNKGYIAL